MKSTGVVRRIDDLGRIVIPKEIRRSLRIREGESLEIYSNDQEIVLKKYSFIESIESFAKKLCESFYSSIKKDIIITDTEKIIAVSTGLKKEIINEKINYKLDEMMQKRMLIIGRDENLEVTNSLNIKGTYSLKPITIYGDIIGCIIVLGDNKSEEIIKLLTEYLSSLISKYFEE